MKNLLTVGKCRRQNLRKMRTRPYNNNNNTERIDRQYVGNDAR